MSDNEKMITAYDNALLGILQNEGKLEAFLDVIFGFLCRRTDFFLTMKSETGKYGFPPGVAEKMVYSYFRKYQDFVKKAESEQTNKRKSSKENKTKKEDQKENEIQKDNSSNTTTQDKEKDLSNLPPVKEVDSKPEKEVSTNDVPVVNSSEEKLTDKSDKEDIQAVFQKNPDSYNGAMRDKYCWSQNYDDVDVKVPVAKSVARGKQVVVDIQRKHLKVMVKKEANSSEFETVIDADLQYEVNREESMWSLESGKQIAITLTKDKNVWWSMLLTTEEEIDIQKICPERAMNDMDEEEKAVINKLQFDDKQKKLGLPQSHELKVHEMLKKGWDAEGSPFQGQDFDPKMFNISPGAVDM